MIRGATTQHGRCTKFFAAVALLVPILFIACTRNEQIVFIQLHPKNPDIIYVTTNDYIYKSRDGGQTWANISKGMSHSRVISMAVDPSYPATVYAGTKGDAVYKSHDGGQRWTSMRSGLDDATISSVVNQFIFDPYDSNHIFVATTMGIFETKSGGGSWTKRMEGMKEVLMVVTVCMDPTREMTWGASGAPTWMICETSRLNANPSFERTVIEESFES